MGISRIEIDERTNAQKIDTNRVQLNLVANSFNHNNQKEPDAEVGLFVNNNFVQTLISDLQGNIKETLILSSDRKDLSIKLQDIRSTIVSNVKDILLYSSITGAPITEFSEQKTPEQGKYIAQLKLNPKKIADLPERAKDDYEIVKYALEQDGRLMVYVSENLKNDKRLASIAIKNEISVFQIISPILQTDEVFIKEIFDICGADIIFYLSDYMRKKPLIRKLIDQEVVSLNYLKERLYSISNKINKSPLDPRRSSIYLTNSSRRIVVEKLLSRPDEVIECIYQCSLNDFRNLCRPYLRETSSYQDITNELLSLILELQKKGVD